MGDNKNQRSMIKKFSVVFAALLIFVIFFAMLFQKPWERFGVHRNLGTVGYVENPWVLREGDEIIDDAIELPEFMQLKTGQLYSVSTILTYDGNLDENPYGFIHLDHLHCRVLLDGEVLFSYMPEDIEGIGSSKSPGFIYKGFALPHDCAGKELKIELMPMLTSAIEYGLPDLEFGDLSSTAHVALVRDIAHNVVTVICILLGFLSILFSTVILRGSNYREGICIGVFSLLFSVYLITESRFNDYYIGNPYYLYIMNYISFSLLPISLMGFMRERLLPKQRKICLVVIIVEIIFFAFEVYFHFKGIYDLREFIPFVHLIYFSEVALIIYFIFAIKDRKRKLSLAFQLTPVMIGMCFDAIIYWLHFDIGGNDATFTILGVIIFMVIELLHVWRTSLSIYTKSVRSNLYLQMAYIDELTAVGNRRAYDNAINDILTNKKIFKNIIVVSADVNELKYVNDNFGHAEGDKLISNVALFIKDASAGKGDVFRTGGDEFAAFLYDVDEKEFFKMREEVCERVNEFNATNNYAMSLAVGYVNINDNDILQAVKQADRNMYEDKAKSKNK